MLKYIIPCSVGGIPSFLILQSPSDSSHCAGDYFPVISDIITATLEKHFHKALTLQFLAQLCKPKKKVLHKHVCFFTSSPHSNKGLTTKSGTILWVQQPASMGITPQCIKLQMHFLDVSDIAMLWQCEIKIHVFNFIPIQCQNRAELHKPF